MKIANFQLGGYQIMETAKHFLINGHWYEKENLVPLPFQFSNEYGKDGGGNVTVSIHRNMCLWNFNATSETYSCRGKCHYNIIRDNYYEDIYYVITGYTNCSISDRLYKIRETDNTIERISSNDLHSFYKYIGQDEKYLYFLCHWNALATKECIYVIQKNGTNSHGILRTYDTSTFTGASCTYIRPLLYDLDYDDSNIYFLCPYDDGNMYFIQYKYTDNTFVKYSVGMTHDIKGNNVTTGHGNNRYSVLPFESYSFGDKKGYFFLNLKNGVGEDETVANITGALQQPIDFYYLDKTQDFSAAACTKKRMKITWNDEMNTFIRHAVITTNVYYKTFILKEKNVDYLVVMCGCNTYANTAVTGQGVYVFRIDDEENLTFMSYNQIDTANPILDFIWDESKHHLIAGKKLAFEIIKLNTETMKYENTGHEVTNVTHVGLDELQRVWYVVQTSTELHMINLEDAQSVSISFEKSYYEFTGTSISTYMLFNAKNYIGEDFSGKFELRIDGPAIFAENASNKLEINYTSGLMQINIIITGASPVTVYPRYIN